MTKLSELLERVEIEVNQARQKYPTNGYLMAALTEETGEVAKALLEGADHEEVVLECIQTACIALRIASEGDASFDYSEINFAEPPDKIEYP